MIGSFVGNYKITEKIGEGGMGAVFKGIDVMLERTVAIKALRPELARQPEIVERFRTEAITLAKLNHPRIATLYNFFRQGDDFFMVMEFVAGDTLEKVINCGGAMSCDRALPLFCQALEGIDHAHSLGIIHRDIKPGNMMFTSSGSIKVMDFGIARVLGTGRMTKTGHLIGTIEYMSPEQVRGQTIDARADLYSMGILLYEMLTGRVPFLSDSEYDLMKSQIEQAPPPPRELSPNLPEFVEHALLRALKKKPEERFATAAEFRAALLNEQANREWDPHQHSVIPNVPKETRVGGVDAVFAAGADLKGTRIAQGPDLSAHLDGSGIPYGTNHSASGVAGVRQVPEPVRRMTEGGKKASSGLNWKHFSAAAVVLVLFAFGAIAVITVVLLSGSKPSPANTNALEGQTQARSSPTPVPSPSSAGPVIGATDFVAPKQPPSDAGERTESRSQTKPTRSTRSKSTVDDAESRRQRAIDALHKNR